MAKFIYTGDHPETTVLRHTFKQGEPTEVTEPLAVRKLRHNCDFKEHIEADVEDVVDAEEPPTKRKGKAK